MENKKIHFRNITFFLLQKREKRADNEKKSMSIILSFGSDSLNLKQIILILKMWNTLKYIRL